MARFLVGLLLGVMIAAAVADTKRTVVFRDGFGRLFPFKVTIDDDGDYRWECANQIQQRPHFNVSPEPSFRE